MFFVMLVSYVASLQMHLAAIWLHNQGRMGEGEWPGGIAAMTQNYNYGFAGQHVLQTWF